ncbi:HalOD1 output domain-containing protein [Halorussus marinus]|uniref:HalOD1 output domain-containing protein n=1 Tax=Halorussus marinus TaxID=2505976 RepID=UPI001091B16C|nr:HalOD1 output domain-containing protein [Halorussus marinus]
MSAISQTDPNQDLIAALVERISEHDGQDPSSPDFCLYDETDPEALELLYENTAGPLTTKIKLEDVQVILKKSNDGQITIEVVSSVE